MLVWSQGKEESVLTMSEVPQLEVSALLTLCAREMKTTLKMKNSGGLIYFFSTSHR